MVFVFLCLLPESAVLRMAVPRMPVRGVLVYQVPVPGTVVPGMTVQMVLASQVSVHQMAGPGMMAPVMPACQFHVWLSW